MKVFDTYKIVDTKVVSTGRPQMNPDMHQTVVFIQLSDGTVVLVNLDENTKTRELSATVQKTDPA